LLPPLPPPLRQLRLLPLHLRLLLSFHPLMLSGPV
jgi:hypothetical protein